MKRILRILLGVLSLVIICAHAHAEDYLENVQLESMSNDGRTAIFLTEGVAAKKKEVQLNAVQSLMHCLFYTGVEGVRSGKALIDNEKKNFTKLFFDDTSNKGMSFVTAPIVETKKPVKNYQDLYQGTVRVQIDIERLFRTLAASGVMDISQERVSKTTTSATPKPKMTIMVVPYKNQGEDYRTIMEKNSNARMAVATVQKGFEDKGIKTIDLQGKIDAMVRRGAYERNTADSNDKELLLTSGSDVYVVVDMSHNTNSAGTAATISLKAYETSSGTIWGSQSAVSLRYRTTTLIDAVYSKAVSQALPDFLAQIEKNYNEPMRVVLQISVSENSSTLLTTPFQGQMVVDIIQEWLDQNAYNGDYHMQGFVDESAIFDYVTIAKFDKNYAKMTSSKFASMLNRYLYSKNITATYRIEGNTIYLTLQ